MPDYEAFNHWDHKRQCSVPIILIMSTKQWPAHLHYLPSFSRDLCGITCISGHSPFGGTVHSASGPNAYSWLPSTKRALCHIAQLLSFYKVTVFNYLAFCLCPCFCLTLFIGFCLLTRCIICSLCSLLNRMQPLHLKTIFRACCLLQ